LSTILHTAFTKYHYIFFRMIFHMLRLVQCILILIHQSHLLLVGLCCVKCHIISRVELLVYTRVLLAFRITVYSISIVLKSDILLCLVYALPTLRILYMEISNNNHGRIILFWFFSHRNGIFNFSYKIG
jgi:hypothetical protein